MPDQISDAPGKRPTRDDVAHRAGVSAATVSYALNTGPKRVSDDKRRRVLAACEELGYQPNLLARSLRSHHSQLIGLVIPDNANPYFASLARSLEDAAYARGFHVLVGNSADDLDRQRAHLNILLEMQVEGVIVIPADVRTTAHQEPLDLPIPTVLVDRHVASSSADVVAPDNELGGALAAEHLVTLGHRQLACISGPGYLDHTLARLRGITKVLALTGLPEPIVREASAFDYAAGACQAEQLLAAGAAFSALICATDAVAIGALSAAHAAGITVPQCLSVVGFDDVPQAAFTVPSLTTLAQPYQRMAEMAVDLLVTRIGGTGRPPQRHLIPPTLVVRESSAPPSSAKGG